MFRCYCRSRANKFLCPLAHRHAWHRVRYHRTSNRRIPISCFFHSQPIMKLRLLAFLFAIGPTAGRPQPATSSDVGARRITIGVPELARRAPASALASSTRGVTLGIEEAQRTARLFGWEVVGLTYPDSLDTSSAVQFLQAREVTAIVRNLTGTLQTRSRFASRPLVLDIGTQRPVPPNACIDGEFYLLPLTDSARLVAWDSSLERFGAAQLNERYRKRFSSAMDEHAWAGWMAIKILVDAVLKIGSTDRCALERYLLSKDGRFDGHKGVPLFFDPRTRELVQPLFAMRGSGEPEVVDVRLRLDTAWGPHGGGSPCPPRCG